MKKIMLVMLVVLAFAGCDNPYLQEDDGTKPSTSPYVVRYEVTGATASSITINNMNDDTQQWTNVSLPWSYEFETYDLDMFMYVSAQNENVGSSIHTEIQIDGSVYESNTSYGDWAIATCSR